MRESETTYPFLTFIVTGLIIILSIVSERVFTRTKMYTTYLSLQSVAMVFIWIYLVAFLLKDKHLSSTGIAMISLIFNYVLNILWFLYYRKKVLNLDESYKMYSKYYPKTQRFIIVMSLLTTFQFFRLQYTRLFNLKSLSCTFQLKEKYYQKLNRYSLL